MEVSKDEDGDQSSPDLNMKRISRGPDEGLDAQVLLDGSEKCLDLPPVFVDRGDRGRAKSKMVRDEHQVVPSVRIDHLDPSKFDEIDSGELFDQHDVFVEQNAPTIRNGPGSPRSKTRIESLGKSSQRAILMSKVLASVMTANCGKYPS